MTYLTYQDAIYATSAETLEYVIKRGDEYIFRGLARKAPGADYNYINVGEICRQYLSNQMPDFRLFSGNTVVQSAMTQTFNLYSVTLEREYVGVEEYEEIVTETLLDTFEFLFNWDYSVAEWDGAYMLLSDPVNGHLDCRMKAMYSTYSDEPSPYVEPIIMGGSLIYEFYNCKTSGDVKEGLALFIENYDRKKDAEIYGNSHQPLMPCERLTRRTGTPISDYSCVAKKSRQIEFEYGGFANDPCLSCEVRNFGSHTPYVIDRNWFDITTHIGMQAIHNYRGSTKQIWGSAFWGETYLQYVNLPNLMVIGDRAFSGCTFLSAFTGDFDSDVYDAHVINLSSVTYIGRETFANCRSLADMLYLPYCEHIGGYAFSGCTGITSVYLNKISSNISEDAFYRSSVTKIYFGGKKSRWDRHIRYTLYSGNGNVPIEVIYNSDAP